MTRRDYSPEDPGPVRGIVLALLLMAAAVVVVVVAVLIVRAVT